MKNRLKYAALPLILAALTLASVPAAADEIQPAIGPRTTSQEPQPTAAEIKGKYPSRVTSALIENMDEAEFALDGNAATEVEVIFAKDSTHTVTVSTALQSPAVIEYLAVMLKLPADASVEIKAYATNDLTAREWTELKVLPPEEQEDPSGFAVYKLEKFARKFSLYRFEITLIDGDSFSIVELQPFGEKTPAMKYSIPEGDIEPGTIPPLEFIEEPEEPKSGTSEAARLWCIRTNLNFIR